MGIQPHIDAAVTRLCALASAPGRPRHVVFAVLLVAICFAAMWFTPALVLTIHVADGFVPLGSAAHAIAGHLPHRDYYTPIGAAYHWLNWLAAQIGGLDGRLIMRSQLLPVPAILVLGGWVVSRRLTFWPGLLIVLGLAFLQLSPADLDGDPLSIAFVASYNRLSWVVLALIGLLALLPRRASGTSLSETAVAALLLVLLFYLKVTFFLAGGALLFLGLLLVPENRWLCLEAGIAALVFLAGAPLVFDLNAAYWHDLQRASRAADDPVRLSKLVEDLSANLLPLILVVGCSWASWRAAGRSGATARGLGVVLLAVLLLLGVGVQNHAHAIPILFVPAAVIVAQALRHDQRGALAAALAVLGWLTLWQVGSAAVGLGVHAVLLHFKPSVPMTPGAMPELRIPASAMELTKRTQTVRAVAGKIDPGTVLEILPEGGIGDFALRVEEGLTLLRSQGLAEKRVLSLTFSQYFPVLLGTTPPRHAALWWDEGRTWSAAMPPSADTLDEVEVVLVPRWEERPLWLAMEPSIRRDFTQVAHSLQWEVWTRRP